MKNIFCFLLVFLVASSAFAVEKLGRITSTDNRGQQHVGFTVMLLGFGPTTASQTGGLSGVFVVDERNLVVIEATRGKWYDQGAGIFYSGLYHSSFDKYKVETKSLGVHYKHFSGNSFYYRMGADYRLVDYHYDDIDENYSTDTIIEFKGKSLAFNFQIGNQWQFKHFNIGCDWIGFSYPIGHEIEDESVQYGTNGSRSRYTEDKDTLLKDFTPNAIRFYVGASF